MTEHNYNLKLLRLNAEGKVPRGPGLWHADIRHDDWCGMLRGGERCNCDPDIGFLTDAEWTDAMNAPRRKRGVDA